VDAIVQMKRHGAKVFEYGNNIRKLAYDNGCRDAFDIPGYVPEYIRPLFAEGKGPFRWVALSGDPEDIYATDRKALELFPADAHLKKWLQMAQKKIHWQGLPARICWLGQGERAEFGSAINNMVKNGELKAPVVIGRDHHDTGSVASPYRETEAMKDGSDAIADWPILNALVNTASGATWVSVHHGGGVGIGYSIHAGMVIVADGTKLAFDKLHRVLTNDPGLGVIRHLKSGGCSMIEGISSFFQQSALLHVTFGNIVMFCVAGALLYVAIAKDSEPLLLIPIAFGMILANIPPEYTKILNEGGLLWYIRKGLDYGIYPPLIFLGIGALTDFSFMLSYPITIFLGGAAQVGIFTTFALARKLGFTLKQAASIGIIGGADGPTSIYITTKFSPELLSAIAIAAYSYIALIPIL